MHEKAFFSMLICIIVVGIIFSSPVSGEGENLLKNPGFEETQDNTPAGWYRDAFDNSDDAVQFIIEEDSPHSGLRYFSIINKKQNDSRLCQDIRVEPGKVYKVTYWLKTENIKEGGGGANITFVNGIYYSEFVYNTGGEWKKFEHYIKTREDGDNILKFWIRLGGFGAVVEGKASFDDVSIELVGNPDPSVRIEVCSPAQRGSNVVSDNSGYKTGSNAPGSSRVIVMLLLGAAIIGLLIYAEAKLMKHGKVKNAEEKLKPDEFEYIEDDEVYEDKQV